MNTLTVQLGERSYAIHIGSGTLILPELFSSGLRKGAVCIITDDRVGPLYLAKLSQALSAFAPRSVTVPNGERHKNWQTLDLVFRFLLKNGFGRDATLVALGGGVIGDLTGFGAACYQRGIAYVQVPTTLLSQVDAAIGGKTAINHVYGKNMIGAFHQPRTVVIDTDTLMTLETREFSAGLAEIIKYGLIADEDLFLWLEAHVQELLDRDLPALMRVITRCCEIKAAIVTEDEQEQGRRALLNLGHTFGHAIERALGYGQWLHGEAVAAGIAMAAEVSVRMDWLKPAECRRICRLLERAGLPSKRPESVTSGQFLEYMQRDKKVRQGRLRLVLPKGIGQALLSDDFDANALADTLTGKPL